MDIFVTFLAVLPWLLLAGFWIVLIGAIRRRRGLWPARITSSGIQMLGTNTQLIPWSDVASVVEKRRRFVVRLNSGFRLAVDKEDWQAAELERGQIRSALGPRAQLKG
ncbi:MAG: YcxB family protein [Gemmatimonadota bacterium]